MRLLFLLLVSYNSFAQMGGVVASSSFNKGGNPNPVVSSNTVSVVGDVVGGTFVYYSPVSSAEKNIKPVAKNVVFSGTEQEGEDLTFSFTLENYTGYDGDNHILRIYKSDDARELNKTLVTTLYSDTETFPAYTLTASESNKYISATVQPNVAGGANPLGELAYSQSSGLIQSLFTSYLTTLFNDSQSQDLNGTSEYITQSAVGALTQPFELWIDVDVQGTTGSQRFWAFSNIIWIGLNGTSPEMRAGGTNFGFGTTTTTGRKTYRFVFDGASSFVQINDGTKYTITSSPGTSNPTNVASYLGVNYALSGNYMNAYFYRW